MNKRQHFLLVEDSRAHAMLAVMALTEDGSSELTVDHVSNGADALAYLRREGAFEDRPRPDLVLLDLKLPVLDGHEVLRQVKDDESLRTIPVVVLSTSDAEGDKARAYAMHANSYLVKPIGGEQFHQVLRDVRYYWTEVNEPPQ